MIEVGQFESRAGAELARSLLGAAGIPAVLAPSQSGGYPINRSRGAGVFVAEADAASAMKILRDHGPTDDEPQ